MGQLDSACTAPHLGCTTPSSCTMAATAAATSGYEPAATAARIAAPRCSGVQVENLKKQNLMKSVDHFIGSQGLETRRFQAVGQLDSRACTAPPSAGASAHLVRLNGTPA
jgi:hypothetical protein